MIGMASSAPGVSAELTLAALAATTGCGSGPVIILAAVLMLVIANAYRRLYMWNASCCASFGWEAGPGAVFSGADVGALAVDGDDLPAVAQFFEGAADRDPGDAVLLGELCLTGQPCVRQEFPGVYVRFDVGGHLGRHGRRRVMVDPGGAVGQGHDDHHRYPVTCEDAWIGPETS